MWRGKASIMEGWKRQAEGVATVQDRETRKKAKVSIIFTFLFILLSKYSGGL